MGHMTMFHISMVKHYGRNEIISSCIVINSISTCTMICNPELLKNIHEVYHVIRITCNVGKNVVNAKGFMNLYGDYVW